MNNLSDFEQKIPNPVLGLLVCIFSLFEE